MGVGGSLSQTPRLVYSLEERRCTLDIYTDGSCFPRSRIGGWSYIVVNNLEITDVGYGRALDTTSNRMEYTALIKAVERYGDKIERIYSDSSLLVNTSMKWRFAWKQNGWSRKRNSTNPKHEIKNLDLVQRIDDLLETNKDIEIIWVKGHNGNIFNEAADELANKSASGL